MRLRLETKNYNDLSVTLWNKYVVDGEKVSKPTDSIQTTASDYNLKLESTSSILSIQNSILPPAVRYIDFSRGIVLFERPPTYATFNYTNLAQQRLGAEKKSQRTLRLPIPWQRYVAYFGSNGVPSKIFIFFANDQIKSLKNDPLSYAPLPNIYGDCSLCLPVYNHIDVVNYNMMDAISNMYNIIWKSGFNADVFQAVSNWMNAVVKKTNCVSSIELNDYAIFYNRWATLDLLSIAKAEWTCPVYDSFYNLIDQTYSPTHDLHDTVVDLYLAAK